MASAYQRKKQPEQVRRALLDCTAHIAASQGFARVSLQAVADAAGVTKGGLLHHFPDRKTLVAAVFEDLMVQWDAAIEANLAEDANTYGCFTRAYVRAIFAEHDREAGDPWWALSVSMVSEPEAHTIWATWISKRLLQHRSTDLDPMLDLVRFAADGAWLAIMTRMANALMLDKQALRDRLIALAIKAG